MYKKNKIVIVGAGGIGRAVGLLLANDKDMNVELYLGDANMEVAKDAVNWIAEGVGQTGMATAFKMPMEGSDDNMTNIFNDCEVVLDCLPGSQAPRIAKMALQHDLHYANLTEYVQETKDIIEMASGAKRGFVLQTGLAPGFINVLANRLYMEFCAMNEVEKVDKITMKVGALTRHASAPHFYGFTWSPIGVATEYLKDAEIIKDYKKVNVPALSSCETIIIDGVTYEDNFTSGGAADLPDYFAGKVKDLHYKTLRFPGHYAWVQDVLKGILDTEDKIQRLQKVMLENIPSVEDDVVIVYSSVKGKDAQGILREHQASYSIKPIKVGTKTLRAIQSTTAAPLAEVARMLLTDRWNGVVFQSQIEPKTFMEGPFVSLVYGGKTAVKETVEV